MKSPPRLVLDTDVVLSALLFGEGRVVPVRLAWERGVIRPLVSKATVEELIRALGYPRFALTPEERHELLGDYLPHCESVRMPVRPVKTPSCRDPFDLAFLQLAVVRRADYLVTGDKDLLCLGGKLSCPIITADALLASLGRA